MALTDVVISADRAFACAIVAQFITVFFKLQPVPVRLASFTWASPAFAAFDTDGMRGVVVTERGKVFVTSSLAQSRRLTVRIVRRLELKEAASALCWRRPRLYVGLRNGQIIATELAGDTRALRPMRAGVASLRLVERDAIFATDERGGAALIPPGDAPGAPVPGTHRHAVLCPGGTVLAHAKGEKWIRVVATAAPVPPMAARRSPITRPPRAAAAAFRAEPRTPWSCIRYGYPVLAQTIARAPRAVREQMRLLRSVCAALPSPALGLALRLGDLADAREMLLDTDPASPAFFGAMLKVALSGRKDGNDTRDLAVASLISQGCVEEAIEICLLTGSWVNAIRRLIDFDRITEAASICRVQEPSEERNVIMEELANKMLEQGMNEYGFILLAEVGKTERICAKLIELNETEQAEFLANH
jgi:hypothetical protein